MSGIHKKREIGRPNPEDSYRPEKLPGYPGGNVIAAGFWGLDFVVQAILLCFFTGFNIFGAAATLLSAFLVAINVHAVRSKLDLRRQVREQNFDRWLSERSFPFLPEPSEFIEDEWLAIHEPETFEFLEARRDHGDALQQQAKLEAERRKQAVNYQTEIMKGQLDKDELDALKRKLVTAYSAPPIILQSGCRTSERQMSIAKQQYKKSLRDTSYWPHCPRCATSYAPNRWTNNASICDDCLADELAEF